MVSYQGSQNSPWQGARCTPVVSGSFEHYSGDNVSTVYEASAQLLATGLACAKVVFFLIDLQAAISLLISNAPTECLHTIKCLTKIDVLVSYGWAVALLGDQVLLGSPVMREPTKKPRRELSHLKRKSP
ncbi:hypothetical protein TNCV_4795661 [Trichonephila clavipes]|nr:hypothetical protein TNCV_4795661 [Trichonephila clavipes]